MHLIIRRILIAVLLALAAGCAMFTSWKSIPPPGGCNQCHSVPISSNWTVSYQVVQLRDERDQVSFQTPQSVQSATEKPESVLELRKVQDQPCFECHKSPSPSHRGRTGRYHH